MGIPPGLSGSLAFFSGSLAFFWFSSLFLALVLASASHCVRSWLSIRLRIVQLSELRGSLAGSTQPTNCTILGIPEGRLPSRMLGSARRLEK